MLSNAEILNAGILIVDDHAILPNKKDTALRAFHALGNEK